MIEEVRKQLFELQDIHYQKFQSNLCPGISNIIGVQIPKLRQLTKALLKKDYRFYLEKVENLYYEETMIEGLLIATGKLFLNEKFYYLKRFIPKIDNWAVCDTVCFSFHWKEEELLEVWNFLKKYHTSKKEFELRFLVVMMMNYFLIDDYWEQVITVIDSISCDFYYTNMAIAWLLSVFYIKNKEQAISYLKNNHLSFFTYQKTIQKILESNRVSEEEKKILRKSGIKGLVFSDSFPYNKNIGCG